MSDNGTASSLLDGQSVVMRTSVALGERHYEIDLTAAADGLVRIELLGHHEGELIGELTGALPQDDIASVCCFVGSSMIQAPELDPSEDAPELDPSEGKAYSVAEIREDHPNAYAPWSADDDSRLIERYRSGATIDELSVEFGRQIGGIRSRLIKLEQIPTVNADGKSPVDDDRAASGQQSAHTTDRAQDPRR